MILFFVECYESGQVVERSHLYADLEFCIELAKAKMRAGFEYAEVVRVFYDENGSRK